MILVRFGIWNARTSTAESIQGNPLEGPDTSVLQVLGKFPAKQVYAPIADGGVRPIRGPRRELRRAVPVFWLRQSNIRTIRKRALAR